MTEEQIDHMLQFASGSSKFVATEIRASIEKSAEHFAETYVAHTMGVPHDEERREGYKQKYIEIFYEKVIENL